jgi:hypothetical protein
MLLLPWFLPVTLCAAAIGWWVARRFPGPALTASAALVVIALLLPMVDVGAADSPGGGLAPALRYAAALLGAAACLLAALTILLTVAVVHRSRVARMALLALLAALCAGAAWLLA